MSRTRIVLAPPAPDVAPTFAVVDAEGHVLERGALALGEDDLIRMPTVLVVPGAEAVARWLHLPTRNDRQARAAALLALGDKLAAADQDVHVALGPLEPDGWRLAVVVACARLRGWLEAAGLHGLRPDVVIPDHLALPEPEGDAVCGARLGATVAVRGTRLALTAEPELLDVLLEGRTLQPLGSAEEVERLVARGALRPAVNLLQGDFDPARELAVTTKDLWRLAVVALLLLISPVVLMAASLARDALAADRIERRTAAKLGQALPGVAITDPLAQLDTPLGQARMAAGGGPVALAANLFASLETIEHGQLERLIVMPDGAVRATLSYTNYSDIELMRAALRTAGVAMREEGVREEQGRVVSDLILGVGR